MQYGKWCVHGRKAIMEVDGVLHSTTPLPPNLSSTGKAPMCPWGNRTPNHLSSSHCCRRRCTPLCYLSTCAVQAQMSPMGSGGRGNYSSQSPSLAKRATGLQLRQQDPIAPCHKNIWPNPMQGLPGVDIFNTLLFPDDRDALVV